LLVRDFAAYSVIDMDRTVETADWGDTNTGVCTCESIKKKARKEQDQRQI